MNSQQSNRVKVSRSWKTKTEELFQIKGTEETWEVNVMFGLELNPGSEDVMPIGKSVNKVCRFGDNCTNVNFLILNFVLWRIWEKGKWKLFALFHNIFMSEII